MAVEPVFECEDLAKEWDRQEETRARIRNGGHLLLEFEKKGKSNDATIGECVQNQEILEPCLHRLFGSRFKLPEIEKLREQVEQLYLNNQRPVDHSTVDDAAWEIRKMLRFVKRKTSKKDASLASCLTFDIIIAIQSFISSTCSDLIYLSEDPHFQDMVLILNPDLEAVRAS